MKSLELKASTIQGTGNAVCKYGVLGIKKITSLLGEGKETPVYREGAGHYCTEKTWVVKDPVVAGLIRSLCRDYKLRRLAFFNRTSLKYRLQRKWYGHI